MSSLGDVVHALPAVTDASVIGAQIDWVVEEAFADIPALHPGVHRVIPVAWRRWRKNLRASTDEMSAFYRELRAQSYDVVIDSQGLIKSAAVALLTHGARHGFAFTVAREPWSAFAYQHHHAVATGQHAIDRQRRLFAESIGYELPDTRAVSGLESIASTSHQVFLLHGTTWQSKHWPLMMWQALAQQISAQGYDPVVTWGNAQEFERAKAIVSASGATLLERQSISELTGRLAKAAAVIGVDSGLAHLSAALGTPTVGLYGPTDAVLTGCRGLRSTCLQAELPCAPCLDKICRKCDYSHYEVHNCQVFIFPNYKRDTLRKVLRGYIEIPPP